MRQSLWACRVDVSPASASPREPHGIAMARTAASTSRPTPMAITGTAVGGIHLRVTGGQRNGVVRSGIRLSVTIAQTMYCAVSARCCVDLLIDLPSHQPQIRQRLLDAPILLARTPSNGGPVTKASLHPLVQRPSRLRGVHLPAPRPSPARPRWICPAAPGFPASWWNVRSMPASRGLGHRCPRRVRRRTPAFPQAGLPRSGRRTRRDRRCPPQSCCPATPSQSPPRRRRRHVVHLGRAAPTTRASSIGNR